MKKFRKLLPALSMLLLSACLLGSSTFAWFSMNTTVTATGMSVKTEVGSHLLIASANSELTQKSADSGFKVGLHLDNGETQNLQPVSTVDGVNFFYTTVADTDGKGTTVVENYKKLNDNKIQYETSGTEYKGYAEYAFELKAINATNTNLYLNLTRLNLLYNNAQTTNKAFRIAMFTQKQKSGVSATQEGNENFYDAFPTSANAIYLMLEASYFGNTNQAISSIDDSVKKETVTNLNVTTGLNVTVPAGASVYTRVTFRLWIEGEDTDCKNANFEALDSDWTLDIKFSLDTEDKDISNIGSSQVASLTNNNNNTLTVTFAENTEDINGATFAWYKVSGGSATQINEATTATYTLTEADATECGYYCVVTTVKGSKYRTNTVTAKYNAEQA